jgi:hypothetical protein
MRYLVALALALLVFAGIPAQASNAAPDEQYAVPFYSTWSAPYYSPYYAPVATYEPAYVVTPAYYRPYRGWRVYPRGYSACWYYYC